MAGGKGTRLQSVAADIPKPMVPVLGRPVLEYQVESLKKSGITELVFIVGHLKEAIIDHFGDGKEFGVSIEYVVEDKPLGTAGALYYLRDSIGEDFVLVFGDLMLDMDFNRFADFHREHGAAITLYGHPNSHPYDSDVIVVDGSWKVTGMLSKKIERESDFYYHNFINAGVYCISPRVLETIQAPEKIDFDKTIIAEQIALGTVFAYKCTEYVKDMGTPDRLDAVSKDIINGVVSGKSLKQKQKAIFLDRDGTLNEYVGFLTRAEQMELIPSAAQAVARINTSPYLAIVATNQPVIARGECTYEELENIHMKVETELGRQGAYLDDIFFCPHHPHKGYEGEVPELKIECDCRKPGIGMLKEAAEKYNIDLSASWYIGDTTMDIQTGVNAGMRTVLVGTGLAGKDGKFEVQPDHVADDILSAVEYILG